MLTDDGLVFDAGQTARVNSMMVSNWERCRSGHGKGGTVRRFRCVAAAFCTPDGCNAAPRAWLSHLA
jgi:hypothetical protein